MSSSTRPEGFGGTEGPAFSRCEDSESTEALSTVRYEAAGELGRGGMGIVTVAVDTWLDREVALKRPHPDLSLEDRERLMREARTTARLDHPGIVPILDIGVDDEGPFYTMPIVHGITLDVAIADPNRHLASLIQVLVAVGRAAAFAHSRGVVHRDLKPANTLVGAFGEVRVLDWGVALDPAEPDHHRVGTPGYQAPEQAAGEEVGPPADVFSLGRMLGDILTRRDDPALRAVMARATHASSTRRYPDAGAFSDELQRWLEGRRVRAHRYTAAQLLRQFVMAWKVQLGVAGAAFLTIMVLLTGWVTTNGWERDRAVAAEAESREARDAADVSLAKALVQTAGAYLSVEARPQAEVLAARSLELADTPEARGVLMAWSGLPRPRMISEEALPCLEPILAPDGMALCIDGMTMWAVHDGATVWMAQLSAPPMARPVRSARFDGHTATLLWQDNTMDIWLDGAIVERIESPLTTLEFTGEGQTLRDPQRVGRIVDGVILWSPKLCARIEDAWTDGERIAAVCTDGLSWGEFAGEQSWVPLDHPPSAVGVDHAGNIVVGTYDGFLLTDVNGWIPEPSGVGAVHRLSPIGEQLLVEGETLTARMWRAADGIFLGRLPARKVVSLGDPITLVGETLQRWDVPLAPARFTRGGGGGLAFLALHPSGNALMGGDSGGNVQVWEPLTGGTRKLAAGCGNVAKSGGFLGDRAAFSRLGCPLTLSSLDWRTGLAPGTIEPDGYHFRLFESFEGGFLAGTFGSELHLHRGDQPLLRIRARAVAASTRQGLWILDSEGGVQEIGPSGLEPRFAVDQASDLARIDSGVFVVAGDAVVKFDDSGNLIWKWAGPTPLTRVDAEGDRVAVGAMDGRVFVLDGEGTLLAAARGHTRRISEVRLGGDVLYTASWDGTVRRWGLDAASAERQELVASAMGWGVSVDDVLERPMP